VQLQSVDFNPLKNHANFHVFKHSMSDCFNLTQSRTYQLCLENKMNLNMK